MSTVEKASENKGVASVQESEALFDNAEDVGPFAQDAGRVTAETYVREDKPGQSDENLSDTEKKKRKKAKELEARIQRGEARVLQSKGDDPRIPEGFVLAPNGDDIVPNGTVLDGTCYTLPDDGGTLMIDSYPSIKKKHGLGMFSQGFPPREKAFVTAGGWISNGLGVPYTSDIASEDDKLSMNELAQKYTAHELQCRYEALMDLRRNQRPFTEHEQNLFDKICDAAKTRNAIESARDKGKITMNGYAKSMKTETLPEEWVWMPNKSQSGIAYFHLESPFTSYQAKVMDARIPVTSWEDMTDSNGRPVYGRGGAVVKVKPSESHLSRQDYEIQKLTMDPAKPRIYRDATGERCLNHWRDVQFPASTRREVF